MMASRKHGTLYVGIINDLIRRIYEHRALKFDAFTHKYNVNKLVYYEEFNDVYNAITREKNIKKWNRPWKISLIERDNPEWIDLYSGIVS